MTAAARHTQWSRVSDVVADTMGLHFPRERWHDLERGVTAAAAELGFPDSDWVLARSPSPAELEVLADHLTIGETYFFRDEQVMRALAESILPGLIQARRGQQQALRIWSAGCCTGEEPYSLAMLLDQALPDRSAWQVAITATDINQRFLRKAAAGVYGRWSFRNTPDQLRERYFQRTGNGCFAIAPHIRQMVNFSQLNLARDVYPSTATGTDALDLIFCRNVLMYFTPSTIRRVVASLGRALVDGGWLAVGPSEASQPLFKGFATVNHPGAIFYRRTKGAGAPPPHLASPAQPVPAIAPDWQPPAAAAAKHPGSPAAAEARGAPGAAGPAPASPAVVARALANQGKLVDALAWCDRWIRADKLDPAAHYLRATILLEQGDAEQARLSLRRATYLQPDFVMAHFALGNLARRQERHGEAGKHLVNTQDLLRRCRPDDVLPESDGLTAGNLTRALALLITTNDHRP